MGGGGGNDRKFDHRGMGNTRATRPKVPPVPRHWCLFIHTRWRHGCFNRQKKSSSRCSLFVRNKFGRKCPRNRGTFSPPTFSVIISDTPVQEKQGSHEQMPRPPNTIPCGVSIANNLHATDMVTQGISWTEMSGGTPDILLPAYVFNDAMHTRRSSKDSSDNPVRGYVIQISDLLLIGYITNNPPPMCVAIH